jgi:hypothetical protein
MLKDEEDGQIECPSFVFEVTINTVGSTKTVALSEVVSGVDTFEESSLTVGGQRGG